MRRLLTAVAIALLGITSVQLGGASGASAAEAVPAPGQATRPRLAIAGWHIQKAQSNLCLVARSGSGERPVEQSDCAEYSDQGWSFDYIGSTTFQIRNLDRNLCLVTRGSGESRAVVSSCNAGYPDQVWTFYGDDTYGGYHFVNTNSRLCLAARGTSRALQTTCGPYPDQVWKTY